MTTPVSGLRRFCAAVVAAALLSCTAACSRTANDGGGATTTARYSGPPVDTADLVARTEPSVALVRGKLGVGTGFLVGPGLLATNAHVIDEEFLDGIEIVFPSAEGAAKGPVGAQLLYEDADRDLALLSVPTSLPPLEVAADYQFRKGDEVTVIGNPGLGEEEVLENAISRGVMSSKVTMEGLPYYQLGIAINPGNSGGPVLDRRGQVVGVASKKATKQEALAFCIPSADLNEAIRMVASRPNTAAIAAASRHRLTNAFRLLSQGGSLYALGLDVHGLAREQGPQYALRSGDQSVGVEGLDRFIDKFDQKAFAPARAQAAGIRNDARIDSTTRLKITQLGDNYAAMKALFSQPVGDLNAYRAQVADLKNKHLRLIDELQAPLKVEISPGLLKSLQADQGPDPSSILAGASPRVGGGPRSPFERMEERRAESRQRMQDFRERVLNRRRGLR